MLPGRNRWLWACALALLSAPACCQDVRRDLVFASGFQSEGPEGQLLAWVEPFEAGDPLQLRAQLQLAPGATTADRWQLRIDAPSGTSLLDDDCAGTAEGQTLQWQFDNALPGAVIECSARYTTALTSPLLFDVRAVARPEDPDRNDNEVRITARARAADLALTANADASAPQVGDMVAYLLQVDNIGPDLATAPDISVTLPVGLLLDTGSLDNGGQYQADIRRLRWQPASLALGAQRQLGFSAQVQLAGALAISATASARSHDPDTSNNTATVTVIGQAADLSISASASTATPDVGDSVTFTLQVDNAGPHSALNPRVQATLGTGLDVDIGSISAAGTYDAGSRTLSWSSTSLAEAASLSLSFVAVPTVAGAAIDVQASVASDSFDADAGNNLATVNIEPQSADLALTASVDNASPDIGANVAFSLALHNAGPSGAAATTVEATLPTGLQVDTASITDAGVFDPINRRITWQPGLLASGADLVFGFSASVQAGIANSATLTANTRSDTHDPAAGNNSDAVAIDPRIADLALTASVDEASPDIGSTIAFSLGVLNSGPSTASNLVLVASVPAGLAIDGGSITLGGVYSAVDGSITWNAATLASAASFSPGFSATVQAEIDYGGGAILSATANSDVFDPDNANNADSVTLAPQVADLALSAAVSPATPTVGATVNYTLNLSNGGPSTAANANVIATLPAGLAIDTGSISHSGVYDALNNRIVWSPGALASGVGLALSFNASPQAEIDQGGPVAVTANASSDSYDPDLANNSASVNITVTP